MALPLMIVIVLPIVHPRDPTYKNNHLTHGNHVRPSGTMMIGIIADEGSPNFFSLRIEVDDCSYIPRIVSGKGVPGIHFSHHPTPLRMVSFFSGAGSLSNAPSMMSCNVLASFEAVAPMARVIHSCTSA